MTDVAALGTRLMSLGDHGHPPCYALQLAQCYKMLSRTKRADDSDSDDAENITTNEVDGIKKAVFEAPLHYTQKVGSVKTTNFSRKDHELSVREQAVLFRKKVRRTEIHFLLLAMNGT